MVRDVLTLTVGLLHFTRAITLTTAKSWYKGMRKWAHQHHVPTRRHKVVMPSLLPRATNIQPRSGMVPNLVLFRHLLLREDSKSNPGHTLLTCPPATTFFPSSTNNRSGPYPVCTVFSLYFPFEPRDRLASLNNFPPFYFLFESSPRFMLQLPPFLPCLNQVLDSTAWSSFTSNNSKKLVGFGTTDGSGKRSTCSHVGSWGSRARPFSKEVIPEGHRDVARRVAGGRIWP
jgi:hypothetical protein